MAENETEIKETKSGGGMKMIIIGIPLFIIQAVAIYFVTANILLSRFEDNVSKASVKDGSHAEQTENSEENLEDVVLGKFIYSVDDIIVNPAGTEGKRLVLASLGFDVSSEEAFKEMEEKEVIVKDIIITIMSRKSLTELKQVSYKDTLKEDIKESLKKSLPEVQINRIYFSKYIIQ